MKTFDLDIVSIAEKLIILKPFASFEANGNGNNNVRTGVAGTTADVVFNFVPENSGFSNIFGLQKVELHVTIATMI
jgi:hypothetical protein